MIDDETNQWQQTVAKPLRERLRRRLGHLHAERGRVAIGAGIRHVEREYDLEDGEDCLALRHRSYLGVGERVTWTQTTVTSLRAAMGETLPSEIESTPARARVLIELGLDELEAERFRQ